MCRLSLLRSRQDQELMGAALLVQRLPPGPGDRGRLWQLGAGGIRGQELLNLSDIPHHVHHHVSCLRRGLEPLPALLSLHDPSPARYDASPLLLLQHPLQQRRLQLPELGPPVGVHEVNDLHPNLCNRHVVHVDELPLRPPCQLLPHRRLARPAHPDEDAVRVGRLRPLQVDVRVCAHQLGSQLETEVVPELGVGLLHALLLCDDQPGQEAAQHAERHGDAVVVMAEDRRASKALDSPCSLDLDPIAQLTAHNPALA
mmetsp:Transcript_9637/g.32261  ORF Transcript_9637/g.32261 Transcript_9637/m.32261 type:complete len:257 (+) Transcript_9637:1626-2396(+)